MVSISIQGLALSQGLALATGRLDIKNEEKNGRDENK